ncbi:hypothetical protein CCL24_26840 [Pseudomonas congelans]|nr:hypothetical protein CCL24_26840 [Pseudomonas congelans]
MAMIVTRLSLLTLRRGNALRDALRHRSTPHCGGTTVTGLSFLTLQRGNAFRDAPRHKSAPLRTFMFSATFPQAIKNRP